MRKQRVLVILDRLSERSAATKSTFRDLPDSPRRGA